MQSHWRKWTALIPAPFLIALLASLCFLLFVAYDQQYWWRNKQDYSFGWIVPLFVAYVLYDRWPSILEAINTCAAPGSPRAAGWRNLLLNLAFAALALFGASSFLLGSLYRGMTGPSHPGTIAISLGSGSLVLTLLFLATPQSADNTGSSTATRPPARFFDDPRLKLTLMFLFPAFVWLVSAPLVSIIEQRLSLFLQHRIAGIVFFIFDTLGLAIEQEGNTLRFGMDPRNTVLVEDACSGIRSLTACLFVGAFLGAVFSDKFWKKLTLIAAAMVLAVITNLIRSLFLSIWSYNYGSDSMEGFVHDATGYAVIGLTLVGLLIILPFFSKPLPPKKSPEPSS